MENIVYVMSDNRSGSTLLDQLLGAHDEIVSLGEVHHLVAYVLQDRSRYDPVHALTCSCGEVVGKCPFWENVFSRLGRDPALLTLRLRFFEKPYRSARHHQFLRQLLRHLLGRAPRFILSPIGANVFNSTTVAADSFDLYDAILGATGAKYVIDSSKDAFRFRALYDSKPDRMRGILLARDYRGIAHSKRKRGRDLRKSAVAWNRQIRQMTSLTRDIPREQIIRVRYEDLCYDPRAELGRICDFLDIDLCDAMLCRPSSGVHHIGGSPSKFDPAQKAIVLDQSYLEAFDESELKLMRDIVGEVASDWGYY